MPSTPSLFEQLATDYPQLHFVAGTQYRWSPTDATIYSDQADDDNATLLHELSHALLGHHNYDKDITLLEMERDAWTYAITTLAPRYHVAINDDTVQDSLDTYRNWLHARSTCPECSATGVQTQKKGYKCLACHTIWRVNDARICALRRYKQP